MAVNENELMEGDIENRPEPSETSSLLRRGNNPSEGTETRSSPAVKAAGTDDAAELKTKEGAAIISLLLVGVFVASADITLVLATYGTVSSEFGHLESGSWLSTAYILASTASQPLTGKLSTIFGRKSTILTCYVIFAVGCLICGTGTELWHVILGRIISGIGGSGMSVIVSILITDLFPPIEFAAWRSYVNVFMTMGRSLGGPIGGILADAFGWRWSFILQVPIVAIAFVLVAWRLPSQISQSTVPESIISRLKRIDFPGAFMMCGTIVTLLLALDFGGGGLPWSSPMIWCLFAGSALLGSGFLYFEANYSKEPVFPPRLLRSRGVYTAYAIMLLQCSAQLGMMFSVPLYFQVTAGASNAEAGSYLFSTVIGNTIGGLVTGFLIQRTGHYKFITIIGTIVASFAYLVLILRWHGHTSVVESLEILPSGLGTGAALSSVFVIMTANMAKADMATGTSGLYLFMNLGTVIGISAGSSVQKGTFRSMLRHSLKSPDVEKIIQDVLSDVSNVRRLDPSIHAIVQEKFVRSLEYCHGVSLILSVLACLIAFTIKEYPLAKTPPKPKVSNMNNRASASQGSNINQNTLLSDQKVATRDTKSGANISVISNASSSNNS